MDMEKTKALKLAYEAVYAKGYGQPEMTLGKIAELWSAYLCTTELDAFDVARMMILLKIGRDVGFSRKADNYTDIAGYAELLACLFANEEQVR